MKFSTGGRVMMNKQCRLHCVICSAVCRQTKKIKFYSRHPRSSDPSRQSTLLSQCFGHGMHSPSSHWNCSELQAVQKKMILAVGTVWFYISDTVATRYMYILASIFPNNRTQPPKHQTSPCLIVVLWKYCRSSGNTVTSHHRRSQWSAGEWVCEPRSCWETYSAPQTI